MPGLPGFTEIEVVAGFTVTVAVAVIALPLEGVTVKV
jgi:hypothetical protein